MLALEQTPAWKHLQQQQTELSNFSLCQAFASNPQRAQQFSLQAAGLFYDFSKQLINQKTMTGLLALADQQQLSTGIAALQQGETVNNTEDRAALHYLLRSKTPPRNNPFLQQCHQQISAVRLRMKETADNILSGQLCAPCGKPFTDIVNIGIGGSDLGPTMIYQALSPYQQDGIHCHYVSNISAFDLQRTLDLVNPEQTLFIIASKSFTTQETLTNADSAKRWLLGHVGEENIGKHFYAVTSAPEKAAAYGIGEDAIFPMWDWVGGRYSTYSAIGLSLAIGLGYDNFSAMLDGADAMDEHFFSAPLEQNMPAIMALIGVWSVNFWHKKSLCIAPYDARLRRFPAYLQQLEMESTGKSSSRDNQQIAYDSCPSIFGEAGTNSQHSYFQHLHQGTDFTPVDFIVAAQGLAGYEQHQDFVFANCLAQAQALMTGKSESQPGFEQHKSMPGTRPSSTIMMQALTPNALGALIALYEHKVYCQSVIWNINAFDQWGVELGKKISSEIYASMKDSSKQSQFDSSTQQLMQRYAQQSGRSLKAKTANRTEKKTENNKPDSQALNKALQQTA